jgi:hypothetical protein
MICNLHQSSPTRTLQMCFELLFAITPEKTSLWLVVLGMGQVQVMELTEEEELEKKM